MIGGLSHFLPQIIRAKAALCSIAFSIFLTSPLNADAFEMNILIFGASGATGSHLVSQALKQGHRVTAFVRTASKLEITHPNLKVAEGDVSHYQQVENAMQDQEVVFSALGAATPFKRDHKLIIGIQNIVAAMTKQNVPRIIYQSFLGVKENRKELGLMVNMVMPVILKKAIVDHEAKEDIITKSQLDWVIVRCPMLTNGPLTASYRTGERIRSSSVIPLVSRADVAHFMLQQISDDRHLHKKPRVMY